ncbi:MAG: TIGR03088 family PEP-CTERM/XrtA system glycosyltransferase [Rhodospirillaceae bacterium]
MPDRPDLPRGAGDALRQQAPLIVHVIYRLDVGGLENGVVNLINHMPHDRFRHAIVSLTGASDFRRRIQRADVPVYCLHKPPGNSVRTQIRLWRILRALRPDIVHTRNLAALECTVAAALAGCRVRIHGEHGRDMDDLNGANRRQQRIRHLFRPLVHRYVAVSADLARYLTTAVGVAGRRVVQIYNGVDTERFRARSPNANRDEFVIGTVLRMEAVKDPLNLVRAFLLLRDMLPRQRVSLRLAMAGDGALRKEALALLMRAGAADAAWLPGICDDVPRFMHDLDVFVLPSLAEGISNTVLEAMAAGLPVVATRVGGNPELVDEGTTGMLVPAGDSRALAEAIARYVEDRDMAVRHGAAARRLAEQRFGLHVMVHKYLELYERSLPTARRRAGERHEERKADAPCAG